MVLGSVPGARNFLSTERTMLHVTQPGQSKVCMRDHQIKTLSWPAQSPDLNPIENLWNVIKRKMDGHKPSNKAEFLEFMCQWEKLQIFHACGMCHLVPRILINPTAEEIRQDKKLPPFADPA
ncbi:hypothetical protein P4O66_001866 [Electrophorus voltai]|uniref:Tc1-like transposase DDE domain-containing protein n=1 Tax=Electrophorus voltai TaxID=2609070 RepID=A0AAD8Z2X4_9TELE|nr:hypothetical protein P4O66_001866 [Electrophorus voltai]